MPNYHYTAKSFGGKTEKGILSAASVQGLAKTLKNGGLVLIDYEIESAKRKRGNIFSLSLFGKVPAREKVILARNLWIMFSSGLPLTRTLDILSAQAKNKTLKSALADISRAITGGKSFSDALASHPNIFSELFINLVKAGEESGKLEEAFENLSMHLEKDYNLKSKLKGAMIYPAIVLSAVFAIGIVIVTFVLPRLREFFSSVGVEVPIYTRLLLEFGAIAERYWYLSILFPFLIVAAYLSIRKTYSWKKFRDSVLLKTAFISVLVKKSNAAIFTRSMSSLLSSGVPLLRSLEITSEVVQNVYVKRSLTEALEKIRRGQRLSESLKPHAQLFPIGTIEIIEVGEESGKTSDVLKKLSEFYEQEIVNATENLATILESLLIVFLGVMVGIFAVSIIQPMYSTIQTIQ